MASIPSTWGFSGSRTAHSAIYFTLAVSVVVLLACTVLAFGASGQATGLHFSWHNLFDAAITLHLNRFMNRWPRFDTLMAFVAERNLLKGAPIVFFCWAAFFEKRRAGEDIEERRSKLIGVVPLAIASVLFARILAVILPFRHRPFCTAALHFQLPVGISLGSLYSWSSFPSDHATLFIALAVGVFFASRRLGTMAIAYAVLFIMFPRVYLGIHWPTDVLAGAALGMVFALIATIPAYRHFVWKWANRSWQFSPASVAALMFLLSYEITDLFATPIALVSLLLRHKHL